MNGFVWAAGLILLPAACTALGAAGVFLLRRPAEGRGRRMLTGGAAGVMLAASIWSLLLPAIERAENQSLPVWLPPAAGLCIGAAGLLWAEKAAGSLLESGAGQGGRMVLAVTLHNLPEGMVTGLAVALALAGAENAVSGAFALSLGIGLQNIPEGAAVSLPLRQQGHSRLSAFGGGMLSGAVEPLFGVLAVLTAAWAAPAMPWLLSFAAGAMLYVVVEELVPQAHSRAGTCGFVGGFLVMMVLDVALG